MLLPGLLVVGAVPRHFYVKHIYGDPPPFHRHFALDYGFTHISNRQSFPCGNGVVRLDAFGSAARGTDFDPERSDADFLVEFGRPEGMNRFHQYFDCKFALEDMLGRSVD